MTNSLTARRSRVRYTSIHSTRAGECVCAQHAHGIPVKIHLAAITLAPRTQFTITIRTDGNRISFAVSDVFIHQISISKSKSLSSALALSILRDSGPLLADLPQPAADFFVFRRVRHFGICTIAAENDVWHLDRWTIQVQSMFTWSRDPICSPAGAPVQRKASFGRRISEFWWTATRAVWWWAWNRG